MKLKFSIPAIFILVLLNTYLVFAQPDKSYMVEKGSISGVNTGRYNNRPLYINNTNAFVLTGDQPIARLAKDQFLYGTFMAGIQRSGKIKWLQNCSQIRSFYTPGTMKWEVSDIEFSNLKITLKVLPMADTTGMAICATAEGVQQGDSIIWAFGGAKWFEKQNLSWKFDVMGQPELLTWGFVPEDCKNNSIELKGSNFLLSLHDEKETNKKNFTVAGTCSASSKTVVTNALKWSNPAMENSTFQPELPLLIGKISPENNQLVYWAFQSVKNVGSESPLAKGEGVIGSNNHLLKSSLNSEVAFAEGKKHTESFQNRLKINTPDPSLNAIAQASVAAVDGTWYTPVFVHGAMQWNNRFPGWRTIFGGTMYGWHDRVKAQARFYTDFQVKTSDKTEAKADPASLLTEQHPDSRYYGLGRIEKDQNFYDMQTQFFDQLVEEYRWTNDLELVSFLREALELHLIWIRDCFDPDGDGIYESYINTWPTDSQWYNGGGCAEETSYAYRGHLAARDMARNAGDLEAEKYHIQMLEKIKKGFFEKLWIAEKGHAGSYREQGGHERLHTDPWLYSIFLPVDAGLISPLQSIESVYYSEWALQNDSMPFGGRQVWTSNWIPGIWSVRELWPGDNYHLALSYFQSGLPDDGYDIFRGTFLRTAFNHISPGNLGGVQGGVDFGDCVHTFSRTLVSGMFGYQPDYPNGKVRIAPQFPSDWNQASIELPDFSVAYKRNDEVYSWSVKLNRAANIELHLPVQTDNVKKVTVNGKSVDWELIPAAGRSVCKILLANADIADVLIKTGKELPYYPPFQLEGISGGVLTFSVNDAQIESVQDSQHVMADMKIQGGTVTGKLIGTKGFHTIFALVNVGKAPQLRVFRIKINDPEGDAREAARVVENVPASASFQTISINNRLNADITAIYKQKYLSPRPNTVSVRLGSDGYSPWTFWHWKSLPPEIKTDKVNSMLDRANRLKTPQGVPFAWNSGENNIAFTSMWDNYPDKIDFPVNKAGDAVWFLVSGSTNVMQCQIANAVIRLNYADGKTDSLELVPPMNYWNLSTIDSHATAPGQGSRNDYTAETDRFCMPAKLPETVQLGENCRAILLNLKLRPGVELKSVSLETISQEVVVGLMGITVMNSN
ncbi:MAG: DUF4450 domain-containing protein [Bacteroidia bacterium]|nr:DUF4450 domain-containing protein [Bacteroidia bacterium]